MSPHLSPIGYLLLLSYPYINSLLILTMPQSYSIADSVNSKTFWYCLEGVAWPDAFDIITIILEITAIILNIFTGFLLLRIKGGDRVSLVLLQNFIINNAIDSILKLISGTIPFKTNGTSVALNYVNCFIWDSRFLYWLFNIFTIEAFTLFALDRALTIRKIALFPFMSAESRLRCYLATIYCFGIAITVPEFFSVNLEGGGCTCAPSVVNVPVLSIIYAHVFLRFFLLVLINGGLQIFSTVVVVIWIRQTPLKCQHDALNYFHHVKQPSSAEMEHVEKYKSWKTASLCILPLSSFYVATFGFDATYQFLSGAGAATYIIGGPLQKTGTMLLVVFSNIAPLILLTSLPVLRFSVSRIIHCSRWW